MRMAVTTRTNPMATSQAIHSISAGFIRRERSMTGRRVRRCSRPRQRVRRRPLKHRCRRGWAGYDSTERFLRPRNPALDSRFLCCLLFRLPRDFQQIVLHIDSATPSGSRTMEVLSRTRQSNYGGGRRRGFANLLFSGLLELAPRSPPCLLDGAGCKHP